MGSPAAARLSWNLEKSMSANLFVWHPCSVSKRRSALALAFFRARGLIIAPVAANHPPPGRECKKGRSGRKAMCGCGCKKVASLLPYCVPDCVALLELHVYCCACIALLPNCFAFAKVHQNYKTKPKAANKVQHMRSCTRKMYSTYCWVHKVQCIRYPQYKMLCKK